MTVTAYTGLPGSGKSHSVVEFVILPALKAGRVVVTNLALQLAAVVRDFPGADVRPLDDELVKSDPGYLEQVAVPGSLLVVDEAQQLWPAGLTANKVPSAVLEFFTKHRHRVDADGRSSDIVLVTQNLANVAMFARSLVAQTFRSVKLDALGSKTRFRVDVYRGAACGPSPPVRERVRQMSGKYREEIWRYYRSHTMRQGEGVLVDESATDRRGVVWRSPWLLGSAAAALVLGIWGVTAVWGAFHPDSPGDASVASEPGPRAPAAAPAAAPQSRKGAGWRITGEIVGAGRDQVFLSDGVNSVVLALDAYCDRDVTGFLICQWQGQEISNQVRRLPSSAAGQKADILSAVVDRGP